MRSWTRPLGIPVTFVLSTFGCRDRPPFDHATIAQQLTGAGYVVTTAPGAPGLTASAGVIGVSCVDATRGAMVATFCVVRCASERACRAIHEGTHESYGSWQRGASLLTQERCAATPAGPASVDCRVGREAVFD